MDNRPIGVFDSGLGGLTTVKELIRLFPNEDIIYFGDTGRVPYGTRSTDTIIDYARQDVRFLKAFDIKAIIIACGTASSVALTTLKQDYDIPIIGVVEGAALRAASATKNNRIGVIGTHATILSKSYDQMLQKIKTHTEIVAKACPLFVPLVENGRIQQDDPVLRIVIEEYLSEIRDFGVDTLILGCTHYPIISDAIRRFMGNNVSLINPGREAVEQINTMETIERCGIKQGKVRFFVSDDKQSFERQAALYLGSGTGGSVELVNINEV